MKKANDSAVRWWSEDKGFYMILLLCVAAVTVAAYVLFVSPSTAETTDPMDGYVYQADDNVTASEALDRVPAMGADTSGMETSGAGTSEETADRADAAETAAPEEQPQQDVQTTTELVFVPPMQSEVSRAYAGDTLMYDETTGDWRTHGGTDYAGKAGDAVCAIANGTVIEIGEDAIYGKYVTFSHPQGMTSLYAGLDEISVSEGDSVTGGKQFAVLGEPMPLEAKQGTHLHLEVTKEENLIDPAQLF